MADLALAFIIVPPLVGIALGYLLSLRPERTQDLSWRKEPTINPWRGEYPLVDHLGRKEPTL